MTGHRVAVYVSDHGLGHATRCLALLGALLARGATALVRAGTRARFIARSLDSWTAGGKVRIVPGPTNLGFVPLPMSLEVDRAATATAVGAEVAGLTAWVNREVAICRSADVSLVISDIVPGAFLVSDRLGVPGLAVSNFSWFDYYADLFPEAVCLGRLAEAYSHADETAVLPFTSGAGSLPNPWPAPLLTRRHDPERAERIRCRVASPGCPVVYLGLGGSFPDAAAVARRLFGTGGPLTSAAIIAGQGLGGLFPRACEIPAGETDGQDYLAAADLAVVKAGYGTVGEAVSARVPLVVLYRPAMMEDRDIVAEVERLGVGVGVRVADGRVRQDDLESAIHAALRIGQSYPELPERYRPDGADLIAGRILRHAPLRVG